MKSLFYILTLTFLLSCVGTETNRTYGIVDRVKLEGSYYGVWIKVFSKDSVPKSGVKANLNSQTTLYLRMPLGEEVSPGDTIHFLVKPSSR